MEEPGLALVAQSARHVVLNTENETIRISDQPSRHFRGVGIANQPRKNDFEISFNSLPGCVHTLQLHGLLLELITPLLSHWELSVGEAAVERR